MYRYKVDVAARETFVNILERWGIGRVQGEDKVEFTSPKLLDMKALKEKRIIKSYKIETLSEGSEPFENG